MSPEVLETPPEEKLHWLENLIDTYEQMQPDGQNGDVAANTHFLVAELLVDEGIELRQDLQGLWQQHWFQAVAIGISADHFQRAENVFSLLERGETVLRRIAELARAYAESSCQDIARLAQFEEMSRAFPIWIKECKARLDMLCRPYPPLNWELIRECQAEYAKGDWEYVEDIIARLENGGPLVKE